MNDFYEVAKRLYEWANEEERATEETIDRASVLAAWIGETQEENITTAKLLAFLDELKVKANSRLRYIKLAQAEWEKYL